MKRESVIVNTSIIGIIFNLVLVIFKALVGFVAGSIAIILDAVNNLTDAGSAIATIVGTKIAAKSPDKEHPLGHGRVEYFTSIIISLFIIIAGFAALKEAILKIFFPGSVNYSFITLLVIFIAVISKIIYSKWVNSVGMSVNSHSLVATATDALMDAILSFTTLVAGVINILFSIGIEGYLGVVISMFIIKSGINIFKDSMDMMIGQRSDKDLTDRLKKHICSYDLVKGAYDLALHNYGPNLTLGTVHISVDSNTTAGVIHVLTKKILSDVYDKFGIALNIGVYAVNDDKLSKTIKKYLEDILKEYKDIKQLHGFYVDYCTNTIYFDLIIGFDCNKRIELRDIIITKMKLKYKDYNYNVVIDDDISD